MNDVAAAYNVVIVDAEKVMADEAERADVFGVWDKYGIDVVTTGGW